MRSKSLLGAILFLILSLSNLTLNAQKQRFVFDQITTLEGLSDDIIRCIVEDTTGFMWFGTEDGLNRFDGLDFYTYRYSPKDKYSISGNKMTKMIIDSKGNMWVGTRNGLNIYDPRLDRFYNSNNEKYKCLKPLSNMIEDIYEDDDGLIWVALHAEGLISINLEKDVTHKYKISNQDDSKLIMSIFDDKNGTIYCGTIDGLIKFDKNTRVYTDLRPYYGYGYRVNQIYIEQEDELLLATSDGFKIIDTQSKKIKTYRHDPANRKSLSGNEIQRLLVTEDGNYILGVDGGGIDFYDKKENRFYHNSIENHAHLSSNNVVSMYQDSHKNLWVGTYMQGLNLSNTSTNLFSLVKHNTRSKNSISPGTITHFFEDSDGDLWIGTDGGGVNLINKKTGAIKTFRHNALSNNGINCDKVICIIQDKQGYIWFGTYGGGLNKYDKKKDKFTHYIHDPKDHYSIGSDKIKVVLEDTSGNIWAGTYGNGISVLDQKTGEFRHFRSRSHDPTTILSDWIATIFMDNTGTIWVGSYEGLNKYISTNGRFKGYHKEEGNPKSLSNNYIVDIYIDSKENFWVGTSGGGLCLFDQKEETFKTYNTDHGITNNNIQSIIEDETSHLWIASKNGITKFNLFQKKGQPYTANDGLPSTTFYPNAKFRTRSGHILLGANNGYIDINPFDARGNRIEPPIVITNFKIFNKDVPINGKNSPLTQSISHTKEILLDYDQNSISFQFAALNYINPERNQFKYKLEGFEKDWMYSGKVRTASYTNLDPGKYTFMVIGSNNDGHWNKEGTSISITIRPPFWATWWFRIIIGVTVLLFIFGFFKIRIQTIKKQNLKLETEVQHRTEEVQHQKEEIEKQNFEMQENITVGKIIQDSILPPITMIEKDFPGSFVYYNPKDIVSGDFYWYFGDLNKFYIAAIDCTGHGVAGAFMSLIGFNVLSDISKHIDNLNAADILDQLNLGVIGALRQRRENSLSRDGMDVSLIIIDRETGEMDFAGAMNNLYIVRKGANEIEQIPANKFSIGIPRRGEIQNFTNHNIQLNAGDHVYMFSDGYADQLGGDDGDTKFMYNRFRELLSQLNQNASGSEKHIVIESTMKRWMRKTEQLDDMLVMGIKY